MLGSRPAQPTRQSAFLTGGTWAGAGAMLRRHSWRRFEPQQIVARFHNCRDDSLSPRQAGQPKNALSFRLNKLNINIPLKVWFERLLQWGRPPASGALSGRRFDGLAGLGAPRRPGACPTKSATCRLFWKTKWYLAGQPAPHTFYTGDWTTTKPFGAAPCAPEYSLNISIRGAAARLLPKLPCEGSWPRWAPPPGPRRSWSGSSKRGKPRL